MLWPLDCFAALAMTMEFTQQLLGIALVRLIFDIEGGRGRTNWPTPDNWD